MAFGFIKKVFSFGKKEVVEEKIDETAPLPPLDFEALKPAAEQAAPDFLKRDDAAPAEPALPEERPAPVEAKPEPAPIPEPTPEQPALAPEPLLEPVEPPSPAPEETPVKPAPEPAPTPAPAPAEVPVPATEPVKPAPVPEPVAPPEPALDVPPPSAEIPERQREPEAPRGEIPLPVRQPAPVETKPVADEVAPEPEAVPPLPSGEGLTVGAGQGEVAASSSPAPTPSPAATPPSGPSDHLPLEGGEEPRPAGTSPQAERREQAGKVTVAKKVEQKAGPQPASEPAAPKRSWFQRMREGLSRSSRELSGNIASVFTKRRLDEDTLQDLEDVLIRADLGVETALRVTDALAASRYGKDVSDTEVRTVMATEVEKVLGPVALPLELDLSHKPHVVLVVGVNGTGKTTTIGKLAAKLTEGGLSVMLAAGDTFRAAAIEQLKIWGERTGAPVVATRLGADAAGLAYDAFERAKEAGSDVLIIDTAGRLQNKTELMAELEKIVRVLGKLDPEAPHTVLQTVDATTGQNALNQVEIFRNVAGVNGLVMTKLDGTARGGILVAIAAKHKLPVYFIGVGEQVDDLEPFSASEFARAIAGVG